MTTHEKMEQRRKLLLVDDDRLVLMTISQALAQVGYEVLTAECAEDAEACLSGGYRPELVILDLRMPGRGGMYLAQHLRDFERVPFMILSAYGDEQIVEQANSLGAMGYFIKPLDLLQLQPGIEAAIARANEIQHLRESREHLQKALDAERNISVATGILMAERRLSRKQAFELLRNTARKQRNKLVDLADEMVRARETLSLGATSIDTVARCHPTIANALDIRN